MNLQITGLVAALLFSGCTASPRAASSGGEVPAVAAELAEPGAEPGSDLAFDFTKDIQPILHARCQPCHFEGGTMYERMPFDDPEFVAHLGTDLFTRLKDHGERVVLLAFFEQMERSAVPEAHAGHGERHRQHHQPHP